MGENNLYRGNNGQGMFMSWILRVALNRLVHDGILNNGDRNNLLKHNFKFAKNEKTYMLDQEYADRIYECMRCKARVCIFRLKPEKVLELECTNIAIDIMGGETCNRIIMKRACL